MIDISHPKIILSIDTRRTKAAVNCFNQIPLACASFVVAMLILEPPHPGEILANAVIRLYSSRLSLDPACWPARCRRCEHYSLCLTHLSFCSHTKTPFCGDPSLFLR